MIFGEKSCLNEKCQIPRNSVAKRRILWLNSTLKTQIPWLGSKFRGPRKTVDPSYQILKE